jgi:transposase
MTVPMKLTSGRMSLDHGDPTTAIRVRNDPMHCVGIPSQSIHLTGGGLADAFVAHLDAALSGQLVERTLSELRSERDGHRAVQAYEHRRRGLSLKQTAAALHVSESTITRDIRRVLTHLPERREPTIDDPYEVREAWLKEHRPLQHCVWEMAGYGWRLADIVETLADEGRPYSLYHIRHAHAAAVKFMGESNRRGARYQGWSRAALSERDTDRTREQMLERDPHRYDVSGTSDSAIVYETAPA